MRRCRFHVIMPTVTGTSADFSKLSQLFESMKLADLGIGLSIWCSTRMLGYRHRLKCAYASRAAFAYRIEPYRYLPNQLGRNDFTYG